MEICSLCGRHVENLVEVDIEYLPSQGILRNFIENRFHRNPSSVMYCCDDCSREIWRKYKEIEIPKKIEGIYLI